MKNSLVIPIASKMAICYNTRRLGRKHFGRGESPSHPTAGISPRQFFIRMGDTKELSIFVDESGSFDSSVVPSRFYIVAFVFHDQSNDLTRNLDEMKSQLAYLGVPDICVHAGPLIRREERFRLMDIHIRKQIFFRLLAFALHAPIEHHAFTLDKRYCDTPEAMIHSLSLQMTEFLSSAADRMKAYDRIKIYYDYGQSQIGQMLRAAFGRFNAVFVENVTPARYRLFQVADLVCTVELLKMKLGEAIPFTKSEEHFFPSLRDLKKNVLRPLARLQI